MKAHWIFVSWFFFFFCSFVLVFRDRVSLYSPGCPGTLDFIKEFVCVCVCVCVCNTSVIAVTCNLVGLCLISVIFFSNFFSFLYFILFYFILFYFILFYFILFYFETGFLCIALAVLELTLQTRLATNSEILPSLPS